MTVNDPAFQKKAIELFAKRRYNPPPQIDNSKLHAGEPMYFYCQHCHGISDIKPEEYLGTVRKVCGECQILIDAGNLKLAIAASTKKELLEWVLANFEQAKFDETKWVLRHYDGFDNEWIDIATGWLRNIATKYCEMTKNDTEQCHFDHIDYYAIFPEDSKMIWTAENKQAAIAMDLDVPPGYEGYAEWRENWDGIKEMAKRDGVESTINALQCALQLHTQVRDDFRKFGHHKLADDRNKLVQRQQRFIAQLEKMK